MIDGSLLNTAWGVGSRWNELTVILLWRLTSACSVVDGRTTPDTVVMGCVNFSRRCVQTTNAESTSERKLWMNVVQLHVLYSHTAIVITGNSFVIFAKDWWLGYKALRPISTFGGYCLHPCGDFCYHFELSSNSLCWKIDVGFCFIRCHCVVKSRMMYLFCFLRTCALFNIRKLLVNLLPSMWLV